ncbi:adenylosuccinate synthase [Ostertagia ostertagi]
MSPGVGTVSVLLGAQWGDEGKGKVIDYLIENNDVQVTARCQGGNNAGHTVVANGKKYDFHILPSGIISPKCFNIIGNGVVVNLDAFFSELDHNGVTDEPGWEKRIMISAEAHLVFGVHAQQKSVQRIEGIGVHIFFECFRNGIRVADLLGDFEAFSESYCRLVDHYRKQFPTIDIDTEAELARFKEHREKLISLNLVGDTVGFIHNMRNKGRSILIEGANGALLDIDFGYQTRVGTVFSTELKDETGDLLQSIGKEVGVTTGRRRRCGWLDLFLLRRSAQINGYTAIALTKLDILDTFKEIKAARYSSGMRTLSASPAQAAAWDRVEVEYKVFPGWESPTVGVRTWEDLPEKCREYVLFIESFIQVPIRWIGVGPDRESLIVRE